MTVSIVFGCLTFILAVLLLYFLDLTVFLLRQNQKFYRHLSDHKYRVHLEEKHKKTKHPKKKNYLLYLIIMILVKENEAQKASSLLPFLKEDRLMGIKKRSIQI